MALDAPPSTAQMAVFAAVTWARQQDAPHGRGQFRPWAMLAFPDFTTSAYRLVFPTLICVGNERAFLHDVRTGSLVQMINLNIQTPCSVDLSERQVFVCDPDVLHVFSREGGLEVLRVPACATVRCSLRVKDPFLLPGDWFIAPLSVSVSPGVDESPCPKFFAGVLDHTFRHFILSSRIAHVSRDLISWSCQKHTVLYLFETLNVFAVGRPPSNRQVSFSAFDQRIYATILISSTVVFVWQPSQSEQCLR